MAEVVRGCDVSNYQDRDLGSLIERYQIEHVVVRLWLPEEIPEEEYSFDQADSARDHGCTVGAYFWLYGTLDPVKQARDAVDLMQRCGIEGVPLWVDLETYAERSGGISYPTRLETQAACAEIKRLGAEPGIYTGNWFVRDYWGGTVGELATYYVWLADYSSEPGLNIYSPYWPRELVVGHQYTGSPVDLDVFRADVTVSAPPPEPTPDGPTYADLQNALGFLSGDLMDGLESEAMRRQGPRKGQLLALVAKGRELRPN